MTAEANPSRARQAIKAEKRYLVLNSNEMRIIPIDFSVLIGAYWTVQWNGHGGCRY